MIAIYKTKCPGPYHIKNKILCQDSYAYAISKNGYIIAAVADGLGSCKHSDVGSKVAADSAVAVCEGKLEKNMEDEEIIEIMKIAYMVADANVSTTAEKEGGDFGEYDTTLCLAIYDGKNLYYGQAGDSGLIALTNSGEYIQVTSQQRDEDGAVFPLCFGLNYWEFGKVEKKITAFALMTDGIWEQLFPTLLKNEEIKINVSLAEKMLNYFEVEESEITELEQMMSDYWEKCPERLIDDDKTSVCVINTDFVPERKYDDYYKEPDWISLMEKAHVEREKKIQHSFTVNENSIECIQKLKKVEDEDINKWSSENIDEAVAGFVKKAKSDIKRGVDKAKEVFKEEKIEKPFERILKDEVVEQMNQSKYKQKIGSAVEEELEKTQIPKKNIALPTHIDVRM